jgi:hypothetical protein
MSFSNLYAVPNKIPSNAELEDIIKILNDNFDYYDLRMSKKNLLSVLTTDLDADEFIKQEFTRAYVTEDEVEAIIDARMRYITGARLGNIIVNNNSINPAGVTIHSDGTMFNDLFTDGVDGWKFWKNGDAQLNNVTARGGIYASFGEFGGFNIYTSSWTSDNDEIVANSANKTFKVGSLTMDGIASSIESGDYITGPMGKGVHISPALIESGKLSGRISIQTANFIKENISSFGGNILIIPSDTLSSDMTTKDTSTITIDGNETFEINDILRIKIGTDDEWMVVTATTSAPTYSVLRDTAAQYGADSNPAWTSGSCVSNYGQSGQGFIYITASDANAPYISIATHSGHPWTTITEIVRIGKLDGITSDSFGVLNGTGIWTSNGYFEGEIQASTMTGGSIYGDIHTDSYLNSLTNVFFGIGVAGAGNLSNAGGGDNGLNNVFIGNEAGYSNTTGHDNIFLGRRAGYDNTTALDCIFMGPGAGQNNIGAIENVFIGKTAGNTTTTGAQNTYLGVSAGFSGNGSNNVFIGNRAGFSETGSNKLYIARNADTTPLIYGDFATDDVIINGNLTVTGNLNIKHRMSLYGGTGMSDIYNSSDTANTWGKWFEVAGATGTVEEFHVAVASATTDAFTIRVWLNGVSTTTLSMAANDSYQEFDVSISCNKSDVIGIDFEDVASSDMPGGVSMVAILRED